MTHRITFTRNRADQFSDGALRELAATLKEQHGVMACVPYEIHNFASQRLDSLARRMVMTGASYSDAMKSALADHRHLAFLATCERDSDAKRCDVTLENDDE